MFLASGCYQLVEENVKDNQVELPKGIRRSYQLPNAELGRLWDAIIVEQSLKDHLLSQAIVNFTVRPKVSPADLPLHGTILLVGAPGTGKTSLARGAANRVAESLKANRFAFLEVDPHALTSSMLGKSQKAVSELFAQSIAEAAMQSPTIVLLDEVETLAVDRSKLSFEANPVDVHRATDAVLVELDALALDHPNLLFIATSNFPQALDSAFTSRCDLVLEMPLPGQKACEQILTSCLKAMGATWNSIGQLPGLPNYSRLVDAVVGLDGRSIRKVVASALGVRKEVALNPQELSIHDLIQAAKLAKDARAFKKAAA
jgi:pachytene checkpoint protein 2